MIEMENFVMNEKPKPRFFLFVTMILMVLLMVCAGCASGGGTTEDDVTFDDDDTDGPFDDDFEDDDDDNTPPDDDDDNDTTPIDDDDDDDNDTTPIDDDDDDDNDTTPEEVELPPEMVVETGNTGYYTDMVLDETNNPYISYHHNTQGLKVAHWDTGQWVIETAHGQANAGIGTSLLLDGASPVVAYHHSGDGSVYFAYKSDKGWQHEEIEQSVGADTNPQISLAQKSDGTYCVAYHHVNSTQLKFACKSTGWSTETVDVLVEDAGDCGQYPSLDFDSSDYAHISYYYYTETGRGKTGALKFAHNKTGSWTIQTVDSTEEVDVGRFTALDVDDNTQHVHVAYQDYTNLNLKYAFYDGSWEVSTVDGVGAKGSDAELKSISDVVWIVYQDGSTNSIRQAVWEGAFWSKSTLLDGFEYIGEFGFWMGMDLNSSFNPVVSHFDPGAKRLCIYPAYY